MIVSASYKTDIPAFYGKWFTERLKAGFCLSYNAYGRTATRVSLRPEDVDGYVFWTKNAGPFLPILADVAKDRIPFVVEYSVTGYPRSLEPAVTPSRRAVGHVHALADAYGPEVAVWRYDPVMLTTDTDENWHLRNFASLCRQMAGATNEVVVSFVQWYRKTERNVRLAAQRNGFSYLDPSDVAKRALFERLADIAAECGMAFSVCSQPTLVPPNGRAAKCVDGERLARVAGRPILAVTKGNRPGCLCAKSMDIGMYDTCPHGCVYCYAVATQDKAKAAFAAHDPSGEFLFPPGAEVKVIDHTGRDTAQVKLMI